MVSWFKRMLKSRCDLVLVYRFAFYLNHASKDQLFVFNFRIPAQSSPFDTYNTTWVLSWDREIGC